jgi:hypothetical protein
MPARAAAAAGRRRRRAAAAVAAAVAAAAGGVRWARAALGARRSALRSDLIHVAHFGRRELDAESAFFF